MTRSLRIYLADLVHDYLPCNYVLPLNIGYVAAYLQSEFGEAVDVHLFKSPARLLDTLRDCPAPDVLGMSNYSWNQELNRHVRQEALTHNSSTIICMGGPHIRTDDAGIAAYLRSNREIDYYVMYEGEVPFGGLIRYFLSDGPTHASSAQRPLPGVAFLCDDEFIYPHVPFQKGAIEDIPSPYLTGILDSYLRSTEWIPLLETNRGCPFACTFCVWGISALDKVRVFPLERVLEDIRYVAARSPCERWIFSDANFGMLERDLEIAREIRLQADAHGVLQHAQVWWAKNSCRQTVEIAKTLGSLSDPLAAVQTMDPSVLRIIKRDNIRLETMTRLLDQFHMDGLKATTDVLVGLPGESLDSHLNTLREVFRLGFDRIDVGNIRLLPGSEMETDACREKYQLRTKYRLISGSYGEYHGTRIMEYEESVRASKDITEEEMLSLRLVHFFIWALSNLGMGRCLLSWLESEHGRSPVDVVLGLTDPRRHPTLAKFVGEFDVEAREEWFDGPEDLAAYYNANFEELTRDGFLKMNSKYVAKLLLDEQFARALLGAIGGEVNDGLGMELAEFCLDRIYFIPGAVGAKERVYSDAVIEVLRGTYPGHDFETNCCRFAIDPATSRAIDSCLVRYGFESAPVRALTLTLESVRSSHFLYDFEFGRSGRKEIADDSAGSFDYHRQLGERE